MGLSSPPGLGQRLVRFVRGLTRRGSPRLSLLDEFLLHLQDCIEGQEGLSQLIETLDALRETLVQDTNNRTHKLRHDLTQRKFGTRGIYLRVVGIRRVRIVLCVMLVVVSTVFSFHETFRCCEG